MTAVKLVCRRTSFESLLGTTLRVSSSWSVKDFTFRGSDLCHSNGSRSQFGARLLKGSQSLSARAALTTSVNSERKLRLEKALFSPRLMHAVDADGKKLSGRRACCSHQSSITLLPFRL